MNQSVSPSLEACMNCYCRSRNLCAAAAVVEHLVERLQDAENEQEACVYLDLFRKWTYITGCHYRSDRFSLVRRQSPAGPRPDRPDHRVPPAR